MVLDIPLSIVYTSITMTNTSAATEPATITTEPATITTIEAVSPGRRITARLTPAGATLLASVIEKARKPLRKASKRTTSPGPTLESQGAANLQAMPEEATPQGKGPVIVRTFYVSSGDEILAVDSAPMSPGKAANVAGALRQPTSLALGACVIPTSEAGLDGDIVGIPYRAIGANANHGHTRARLVVTPGQRFERAADIRSRATIDTSPGHAPVAVQGDWMAALDL